MAVAAARVETIREIRRRQALLEAELRQHLVGLGQDLGFGARKFAADDLAIVLAESSGTAERWMETAEMFCAHPAVMARVADGSWSIRHADAVLSQLAGSPRGVQEQVVAAVLASGARTPYQLGKAAQTVVYLLDPDAAERKATAAKDDRTVGSYVDGKGGGSFWAGSSKADVAQLLAALDVHAAVKQPGDTRTLPQRRFDALMDLVCGRLLPGAWQAIVLVEHATLTGTSDAPAEIPGLGLITATEARELLAQASLRRAVIDGDGHLVSVDATLTSPDAANSEVADTAGRLLTDQPEPAGTLDTVEEITLEEQAWLAAEAAGFSLEQTIAEHHAEAQGPEPDAFTQQVLTELLDYVHAHTSDPGGAHIHQDAEGVFHVQLPGNPHDPPGGIGPPPAPPPPHHGPHGQTMVQVRRHVTQPGPPDPQSRPARPDPPPSQADEDWHEISTDHGSAHALIDWQYHQQPHPPPSPAPPGGWPVEPCCRPQPPAWTPAGLQQAARNLRTRPAEPRPATGLAYAFGPRASRHIKLRDQHCTFPGCYRLARSCDNDHLIEWPQGPTHIDNAATECRHHHQAKHHHLTVTKLHDGTLRWTTPTGHHADTPPRKLLRGW
ncbi:MAG: putative endonuclease [Frankiales bacterium]|nr:putative endonuclease [Frankiales bacterium]